jgi:hypothetical protein
MVFAFGRLFWSFLREKRTDIRTITEQIKGHIKIYIYGDWEGSRQRIFSEKESSLSIEGSSIAIVMKDT